MKNHAYYNNSSNHLAFFKKDLLTKSSNEFSLSNFDNFFKNNEELSLNRKLKNSQDITDIFSIKNKKGIIFDKIMSEYKKDFKKKLKQNESEFDLNYLGKSSEKYQKIQLTVDHLSTAINTNDNKSLESDNKLKENNHDSEIYKQFRNSKKFKSNKNLNKNISVKISLDNLKKTFTNFSKFHINNKSIRNIPSQNGHVTKLSETPHFESHNFQTICSSKISNDIDLKENQFEKQTSDHLRISTPIKLMSDKYNYVIKDTAHIIKRATSKHNFKDPSSSKESTKVNFKRNSCNQQYDMKIHNVKSESESKENDNFKIKSSGSTSLHNIINTAKNFSNLCQNKSRQILHVKDKHNTNNLKTIVFPQISPIRKNKMKSTKVGIPEVKIHNTEITNFDNAVIKRSSLKFKTVKEPKNKLENQNENPLNSLELVQIYDKLPSINFDEVDLKFDRNGVLTDRVLKREHELFESNNDQNTDEKSSLHRQSMGRTSFKNVEKISDVIQKITETNKDKSDNSKSYFKIDNKNLENIIKWRNMIKNGFDEDDKDQINDFDKKKFDHLKNSHLMLKNSEFMGKFFPKYIKLKGFKSKGAKKQT